MTGLVARVVLNNPGTGLAEAFGPDDELPEWAVPLISNPKCWADGQPPQAEPDAAETPPEGAPSAKWKVNELKAYAAEHGIDLSSAKSKPNILAAVGAGGSPTTSKPDDPENTSQTTGTAEPDPDPDPDDAGE